MPGGCHGERQFRPQDFENALHASRAERAQAPEWCPAHLHGICTQRQSLENVAAAPYAAVHQNRDAAADRVDDFRKYFKRGRSVVQIAPAVIGNNDPVDAVFHCQLCVLRRENAFQQQRSRGVGADLIHCLPCIPGILSAQPVGHRWRRRSAGAPRRLPGWPRRRDAQVAVMQDAFAVR